MRLHLRATALLKPHAQIQFKMFKQTACSNTLSDAFKPSLTTPKNPRQHA